MSLKEMQKSSDTYTLREAMTLEELHQLLQARWTKDMPGTFKLKKSLLGKHIRFETRRQVQPRVKIKDNVVTIRKLKDTSTLSVGGGPALDLKDMKQMGKDIKAGGMKAAVTGGADYFNGVCDALRQVLSDKLV